MELSAELSKAESCLTAKQKSIDHPDSCARDDDLTPPPVPPLFSQLSTL